MSSQNNPEVEIAVDPIQSPNSLRSTNGSYSTTEKRTPTVYICGLLPKRYHNQSLYAIAHDLMPDFFISTNPIQPNRWNCDNTREMLRQTEALIFLLNEVTVADRRCLLTLQYAWELNVPIVMLRQPRVRLIIKPASAAEKSAITRSYDSSTPNMPLLQDIIYEAYKHSLEYDRNNHLAGMRKLVTRLRQIVESNKHQAEGLHVNSTTGSATKSYFHSSDVNHLKLPPIPSPPHNLTTGPVLRRNTIGPTTLTLRSSSLGNLAKKGPESKRKLPNGNAICAKQNGHHADDTDASNGKQILPFDLFQRHLTPFESTDDPALYHETQYLLFPMKDKNQKPRLIRFPSTLTDKHEEQDIDSIWGSDTSLEEEAGLAERVTGSLDVHTPPGTPAPYIDPL